MNTTVTTTPDGTLCLGGSLGIYDVEELCQALLAHLRHQPELRLDLGALAECDTAGAQLLCAARHGAALAGKPCSFLRVPPAVSACLASLGLPSSLLAPAA